LAEAKKAPPKMTVEFLINAKIGDEIVKVGDRRDFTIIKGNIMIKQGICKRV
jgi:hypothetical protein